MADEINTNYYFIEPEVGTSEDTWGDKLNDNWGKVDALFSGTSYTDYNSNVVQKISPDLTAFKIDGVTVTATAAELNNLDGVTATGAELNILDGATVTTAELNILDGVTATTAEINLLDGVTATTAELNYIDGVTSNIQTQLDARTSKTGNTGSSILPAGTTAQRDGSPAAGYFRYNSDYGAFEGYNGSSWGSVGGATGAGGDQVFYENDMNVTTSYTITSGKNAMSSGGITIDSGATVTVPTGSNWTIV